MKNASATLSELVDDSRYDRPCGEETRTYIVG